MFLGNRRFQYFMKRKAVGDIKHFTYVSLQGESFIFYAQNDVSKRISRVFKEKVYSSFHNVERQMSSSMATMKSPDSTYDILSKYI